MICDFLLRVNEIKSEKKLREYLMKNIDRCLNEIKKLDSIF